MDLTLRRWRARHLLLAWSAYWVALAAVALAPAARAIARVSGPGEHGNVAAVFGDGLVRLTVTSPGAPAWTGTVTVGALAFWVAVPPLLLWLLWLVRRPLHGPVAADALSRQGIAPGAAASPAGRALPDAGFAPVASPRRSAEPVPARPDRPA